MHGTQVYLKHRDVCGSCEDGHRGRKLETRHSNMSSYSNRTLPGSIKVTVPRAAPRFPTGCCRGEGELGPHGYWHPCSVDARLHDCTLLSPLSQGGLHGTYSTGQMGRGRPRKAKVKSEDSQRGRSWVCPPPRPPPGC